MKPILLTVLMCALSFVGLAETEYSKHLFPRQMEPLNRGLVAVAISENEAFLSWRLLNTDAAEQAFDVYKKKEDGSFEKLNDQPLTEGTNFCDKTYHSATAVTYCVKSCSQGKDDSLSGDEKVEAGSRYTLAANSVGKNYHSIPLQTLEGCTPGDCSIGDLDGDGEYEIVVKQEMRPHDNSHDGMTGQTKLEAYKMDGRMLWRIDLGRNIREGAHYTQFLVYDFDGDGKAEVACKTADASIDGQGKILGDAQADWRSKPNVTSEEDVPVGPVPGSRMAWRRPSGGHILSGPEYLTVFDGESGAEKATASYIPARHPKSLQPTEAEMNAIWGDGHGNRSERYLACVAYLDGQRPSLVFCRGYYSRSVLAAWDYRDGKLSPRWVFDSDDPQHPENRKFRGQGNHNLSVADVDGDGYDEIVYGNMVVDHDGKGLYSTGIGHADAMHVSDLDPDRKGLEIFNSQERVGAYGMNFRNAGSGEIYWSVPTDSEAVSKEPKVQGPGRDVAFDIDPRYRGAECWVFGGGISGLYSCKGVKISDRTPASCNFAVWWDGDLLRELLDRNMVYKYRWEKDSLEVLFTAEGCTSNNGTKSTPALSADIYGDWREEVILRTRDNSELRIYTTYIPTRYRFVTLMHDPVYRLGVAWQNVGYNIPPHVSFYMEEQSK